MRYRKKDGYIEAVKWEGYVEVFKPWMDKYGGLPIRMEPLPAITLVAKSGDILVEPGDYIVRHWDTWIHCEGEAFESQYEPVEAK